jgi:thiol-disulfide isomerase/thioredoxin
MMIQKVSRGHRRLWYCVRIHAMAMAVLCLTTATVPAESGGVAHDPFLGAMFPTVNKTGLDICTTDDGKPVIFLFSTSSCSHCEWAGEAFDFVAKYYISSELIEAHHYDIDTGDDLLTEEVETKIPPAHLRIKEHGNPKGIVPYFNFSCKYERHGNGYEKKEDLAAECAEIRQVIDTLIQMLSEDN